jgi:DNA polymerase-3 subunit epsilon
MRQIVLDTETTGIGSEFGHRIIEIGCVELVGRKLTGNHFHTYLNPLRDVDEGAFKVHGISTEFLQDKPFFGDIVQEFLQFIDGSEVIIHNAPFDVGFLKAELKHAKWPKPLQNYCTIFDTLVLARNKHPGQRNSLDALCKRYDVDNSNRELHGALLDAEILALVYLAMTGGQTNLFIEDDASVTPSQMNTSMIPAVLTSGSPVYSADADEVAKHNEFIQFLVKKSGINLWDV